MKVVKASSALKAGSIPVRTLCLGVLLAIVVGASVSDKVPRESWQWLHDNGGELTRYTAVPTTVLALYEIAREWVTRKADKYTGRAQTEAQVVAMEVERACYKARIPVRLSECALKVWRVKQRSLRDRVKNESRRPLQRVFTWDIYRPRGSSGIAWRVGMGVIGVAAQESGRVIIRNLQEEWEPLRDCDEATWDSQPAKVRYGLTYEEFKRVCPVSDHPNSPAGNLVMAVSISKRSEVLGVVALDAPRYIVEALEESDVDALMDSLGRYVLG